MQQPSQKLPYRKKDKQWREDNVKYLSNLTYMNSTYRLPAQQKRVNYDLYNGKMDMQDFMKTCQPYERDGKTWDFPATAQNYDIIHQPVDALWGEEMAKPDSFFVVSESQADLNRKNSMLSDKIAQAVMNYLAPTMEQQDPNNPPPTPQEVIDAEKSNPSDYIEQKMSKILKSYKSKLNIKEIFGRGYKDLLVGGEEIYWTGLANGNVMTRRVNPIYTDVILDPNSPYIDDAYAVIERRSMTIAQILDEFGDDLEESDIKEIERLSLSINKITPPINTNINNKGIFNFDGTLTNDSFNTFTIPVIRVEWKSLKLMKIYTYFDVNTQSIEETVVDEEFTITTEEKKFLKEQYGIENPLEEFWVSEAWAGYRIGLDLYIAVEPKQNQRRTEDNPYHCKLGYSGYIIDMENSICASLVTRLKPLQYMYNVVMYNMEKAINQSLGRVLLMDVAQIPRSEGIDVDKWLYYLKSLGIVFVNSFEEGKKQFQGQRPNFNQFQMIDLSLAQSIKEFINILEYIKSQAFFMSGVDLTRMGQQSSDSLVGTAQINLAQSANVTRKFTEIHSYVKQRVYTSIIECAKIALRESQIVQHILDDGGQELIQIEELEFENSDFNVYVSNATKHVQMLGDLKQLFQTALQTDKATLASVAKMMQSESITEGIKFLEQAEEQFIARQQQAQESQNQIAQQQIESNERINQAKLDWQANENQLDRENNIEVATLKSLGTVGINSPDVNQNQIPDVIEQGKLALDQTKLAADVNNKNKELEHKKQVEDNKLKIEQDKLKLKNKELDLKDKQMKNDLTIAKISKNKPKK